MKFEKDIIKEIIRDRKETNHEMVTDARDRKQALYEK